MVSFIKGIKLQLRSNLSKKTYTEGLPADSESKMLIPTPPFTEFRPGSSMVVFECGSGEEDRVRITPYHGEKHGHHDTSKTYQANLIHTKPLQKEHEYDIFTSELTNLMPSVELLYNPEEDGMLRVVGRFGKLYYFDEPPSWEMKVKDIREYEDKTKTYVEGARQFQSSFIPKLMPHKSSEVT